jgi:predicted N-acyltransferase
VIRRLPLETGHLRRLNAIVRAHYLRKNGEDPGYPEELFLRLAEGLPEDFIIFEARRGDHVLGMASLVRSGTVAWASWMGMVECDEQQDFTYFNLCYYHLAEQAAALGIRRVLYGTTAYGAKRQRGCEIVVNPVHYRPHATLTRVLARPYVRFHRAWYRRKFP